MSNHSTAIKSFAVSHFIHGLRFLFPPILFNTVTLTQIWRKEIGLLERLELSVTIFLIHQAAELQPCLDSLLNEKMKGIIFLIRIQLYRQEHHLLMQEHSGWEPCWRFPHWHPATTQHSMNRKAVKVLWLQVSVHVSCTCCLWRHILTNLASTTCPSLPSCSGMKRLSVHWPNPQSGAEVLTYFLHTQASKELVLSFVLAWSGIRFALWQSQAELCHIHCRETPTTCVDEERNHYSIVPFLLFCILSH